MATLSKIWKAGNSLVITIPTTVKEYYMLKEGDIVEYEIIKARRNNSQDGLKRPTLDGDKEKWQTNQNTKQE